MLTFALLRDSSDLHIYKDLYGENEETVAQTGSTKTNRMAINRLKDHTGGKKHSTKVR